ncbi:MAG: hypothetical protein ACRD5E_06635 [Nitrososphaeraceae archaeon]
MKTAAADQCQHPKHKEYLVAFLKKYPTASKDAHFAINMVDPEEWWISDDPKEKYRKMLPDVWYFRGYC